MWLLQMESLNFTDIISEFFSIFEVTEFNSLWENENYLLGGKFIWYLSSKNLLGINILVEWESLWFSIFFFKLDTF